MIPDRSRSQPAGPQIENHFADESDPRPGRTPACMHCYHRVNQKPSRTFVARTPENVDGPRTTQRIETETNEFKARGEFVIFFTNSLSTVSAGLWLSTSRRALGPRIRPHPHVSHLSLPCRRSEGPGRAAGWSARPTGVRRHWQRPGDPGVGLLFPLTSSVDSHRDPLPVVCSPPAKSRS